MKIALLGGTFNPVHYGHLQIAKSARKSHRLDQVLFIPAGLPPHKKRPLTSAKHRLAMLRLAIRGQAAFKVNDWEIRQRRVVYTYETLEHFRRQYPRASLYFIIGSDSRKNLPRWREAQRLPSLCRFITMKRLVPYASHMIRRRVCRAQPIRSQVPEVVERYIRKHRLYQKPE